MVRFLSKVVFVVAAQATVQNQNIVHNIEALKMNSQQEGEDSLDSQVDQQNDRDTNKSTATTTTVESKTPKNIKKETGDSGDKKKSKSSQPQRTDEEIAKMTQFTEKQIAARRRRQKDEQDLKQLREWQLMVAKGMTIQINAIYVGGLIKEFREQQACGGIMQEANGHLLEVRNGTLAFPYKDQDTWHSKQYVKQLHRHEDRKCLNNGQHRAALSFKNRKTMERRNKVYTNRNHGRSGRNFRRHG